MINQNNQELYYSQGNDGSKNKWFLILIGVVILGLIIFLAFIPKKTPTKPECGNNICEAGENCYDCFVDCKCKSSEYCSVEKKVCIEIVCGNGICDPGETSDNCCDDCECVHDFEICNRQTHSCYIKEASITDEEVISIVRDHYLEKGLEIDKIEILGSTQIQEKEAKSVAVYIKDQPWQYMVAVTVDGEIIEIPTF